MIEDATSPLSPAELADVWPLLLEPERLESFKTLSRIDAEEFFYNLHSHDQAELLRQLQSGEQRSWIRILAPDDAADLIQESPHDDRDHLLSLLDTVTRSEVSALLAYEEDEAGGVMNPRFLRLRPDLEVGEAISYLRKQASVRGEGFAYAYVIDANRRLLGVVSVRELLFSEGRRKIADLMETKIVTVHEETDQERLSRIFADHDLAAIPVIDDDGRMVGIVTADDIVDVIEEEATEDIQKIGGMEALDEPYLEIGFLSMIRKRGGWLSILFLGEMLTATAMGYFEHEIAKAVVLSLFIPLIISSGGNSGSQAATLVVRAMALGEVRMRDWWRVVRREFASGIVLGGMLALLGFTRIVAWHFVLGSYGQNYMLVAMTVAFSLVGVVMWGTLSGSMLPMLLRRMGFDPASASAPFVATLVDVSGLVIYFTVASIIMRGTLL